MAPVARHIEAVVFDVGHVLFDWHPRHLYLRLIDDPDRLEWFLANVVTLEWHFQHDAGMSVAEANKRLIALYPEERALIEAYAPRFNETVPGPIPGSLELVDALAARDVPLYAITNFGAEFWAGFRPTQKIFDHFRDIVVSGVERMVKPDPAIFRLAVERFGIDPATSLFIDDRADNVAAARAVGMAGHVFRDAPALKTALIDYGLLQG